MHKGNNQHEKLSIFDHVMEWAGWLQIAVSPLLGGLFVGGIAYLSIGNTAGLAVGILITAFGLAAGIILANRIWKKKGTIRFMSGVNASPELDSKSPGQEITAATKQEGF